MDIKPWQKRFSELGIILDVWNTWPSEDADGEAFYVEFYINFDDEEVDYEDSGGALYDAPFYTINQSFRNMNGVVEYIFSNYEDLLKQILEALKNYNND